MSLVITAIVIAFLSWWFATGAIILVARWGYRHKLLTMLAMSIIAASGIIGLVHSSSDNSVAGVYHGFAAALAVWAWHEAAFLLGIVTGPRKLELDKNAVGLKRFTQAYEAIRDHELSLFISLLIVITAFAGSENLMGLMTFALLWAMRLSTKLNVFLGAPNAISDMLPERLDYLTSYFRTDRIAPFFWYSMTLISGLFLALIGLAMMAVQESAIVALSLLASFVALALVEHLFLVLPIRDSALWAWCVPNRSDKQTRLTSKVSQKTAELNLKDNTAIARSGTSA